MAVIRGTPRKDSLIGVSNVFGATNEMYGYGGDDRLTGGFFAVNYIYGGDGNDALQGGAHFDRLYGGDGNDVISGWQSDNVQLFGEAGDDILRGSLLDPAVLDGGSGADQMTGGEAGDTYYVDHVGDIVDETYVPEYFNVANPPDLVIASISYTLGSYVENLTLSGNATLGTGNDVNNTITGNAANNELRGLGGHDVLLGSLGDDTLEGGVGSDRLSGGVGNDRLDGGAGIDLAVYEGASAVRVNLALTGAQNTLGAGTDTLIGIENLLGGSSNDVLLGNTGSNQLIGGLGNDLLFGGLGNDLLNGGAGVDTASYASAVAVTVNLGLATAQNTVGAGLDTLTGIENLIGSSGGDTLSGNAAANSLSGGVGNDRLNGGDGNDVLNGGAGADRMEGGGGNDIFYVDQGRDVVVEVVGQGTDTIVSTIGYSLGALPAIENLTLIGSAVVNGAGNALANAITGNAAANVLSGGDGNDRLSGGAGDDVVVGGRGNDRLDGGAGTDVFRYLATSLGSADVTAGTVDTLIGGVGDRIDFSTGVEAQLRINGTALSSLAADAAVGASFSADTNIRFDAVNDRLQVDLNRNGSFDATDFQIGLTGVNNVTYHADLDLFLLS